MKIKLFPDKDIKVQKKRIGNVPTLILTPADRPAIPVGVLWIHGGGYICGMKEMVYMSRAMDLVKNYGVTVLSPGYRQAWQKPYPAAVDDCYQVLEYMDGSFDTIMAGGESAGGGLCAALCMMARDRGKIKVAFQMPLYPMISNVDTDSSRNNHGKMWNTRKNHFAWKMYLRKDAQKAVSPYAAPIWQEDFSGLPPCYTFVGDGEPFYSETLDYVNKLRNAGVTAEADVYPCNIHAFDMLYPEKAISKDAIDRFEKHFEYALENYC